MTDEEKMFRKLCDYVKKEIMGYDENQQLSKFMIMRLRGLPLLDPDRRRAEKITRKKTALAVFFL